MKRSDLLTATSLLSIILFGLHVAGDVVRGIEQGRLKDLIGTVVISVVWLCGTLLLAERRAGKLIMLLGALLAAGVAVLHMKGAGVGAASARGTAPLSFIWPLFALGVTGTFSLVLLALEPWRGKMSAARDEDPGRRG